MRGKARAIVAALALAACGCCSTFEAGYQEGRREALLDALETSTECADRAEVERRLHRLIKRSGGAE